MTSATRVVATALGVYAGLLGAAHGILEIGQGSVPTGDPMIQAIGPPCQMDAVWHGCLPAMTLVPTMSLSGVLALLVSLVIMAWAALFVDRKRGGLVLILLSVLLLVVGGGFIPMLIGIVAGAAGTRIDTPPAWWRRYLPAGATRILARLWPWSLVAYFVWVPIQWTAGTLFNEFMLQQGFLFLLLELGLLLLAVLTAFAADVRSPARTSQPNAMH
jgi:hypothetical protein